VQMRTLRPRSVATRAPDVLQESVSILPSAQGQGGLLGFNFARSFFTFSQYFSCECRVFAPARFAESLNLSHQCVDQLVQAVILVPAGGSLALLDSPFSAVQSHGSPPKVIPPHFANQKTCDRSVAQFDRRVGRRLLG
jgi:hypothetical protein